MTELALPPAVDFGYVVGQFMPVVWDTADPDRFPGGASATGKVTFTPLTRVIRTPAPDPMTVLLNTVVCNFDANGRLIDSQNALGVWLVAGTYKVTYDIVGHQLNSHDIEVTNFNTEAEPLDLTLAAPPDGPPLTSTQYSELRADIDALVLSAGGVLSVNGATGIVTLNAASVGALPSSYTPPPTDWTSITSRPTTFPPSGHLHEINQINGLQAALDAAGSGTTVNWDNLLNKPAVFPPDEHSHPEYATVLAVNSGLAGKAAAGIVGLPAGTVVRVYWTGTAWPVRPTGRTDISIEWVGGSDAAPPTAGVVGVDTWMREVTV